MTQFGVAIRARVRALGLAVVSCSALTLLGCDELSLDLRTPAAGGSASERPAGDSPLKDEPVDAPPSEELRVTSDLDLSVTRTGGSTCADGGDIVAYGVEGGQGVTLILQVAPSPECLLIGDEILLAQLQGAPEQVNSVGNAELLRVQAIDGNQLTLVAPPLHSYGMPSNTGFATDGAHVVVQRVPSYTRLTVGEGTRLSAGGWGPGGTGMFVARVLGDLKIEGILSMSGLGYAGGAEQPDALAHGVQGESLVGVGLAAVASNLGGGGGGLGDQETSGCQQDGNAGGGGAHLLDGDDAVVADLCQGEGRGRGGQAYAQVGRLFLGSGGGSGGTDNVISNNPPGAPGGAGGGIVWLLAQSVSGQGRIEARGLDGGGDLPGFECEAGGSVSACYDHSGPGGGGAGGTIRLSTPLLSGVTLDVSGGRGGNGYDQAGGNGGDGSLGVLDVPPAKG